MSGDRFSRGDMRDFHEDTEKSQLRIFQKEGKSRHQSLKIIRKVGLEQSVKQKQEPLQTRRLFEPWLPMPVELWSEFQLCSFCEQLGCK